MRTKIGEIKSMMDFFEKIGKPERENPSGEEIWAIWTQKVRCKICGEKLSYVTGGSAWQSGFGSKTAELEEHLEMHKSIKELGIEKQ